MSVKATYIFPGYKPYSSISDHENNIALLKLMQPFEVCDKKVSLWDIVPVKLNAYKSCLIFGWQSSVSSSSRVLAKPIHYNEVILKSWKMCINKARQQNATFTNTFCATIGAENRLTSCFGNSGSPVTCEDEYKRTTFVGIASRTNFSLSCCSGFSSYISVNPFRDWMCNLILKNKDSGQQDSVTDIKSMLCKQKQYLGDLIDRIHSGNASFIAADIDKSISSLDDKEISLQQSLHVVADSRSVIGISTNDQIRSTTFPQLRKKIQLHEITQNDYETLSIPRNYYNTIVLETIKHGQSNLSQNQDIPPVHVNESIQVVDAPIQKKAKKISNKHLSNEDRTQNKLPKSLENFLNDKAEFLFPFYFEAANSAIADSLIHSYCLIVYFICLYYLYNICLV